jgi:hypothetical protein
VFRCSYSCVMAGFMRGIFIGYKEKVPTQMSFLGDHCVLKIRLLTPAIVSKGVQRTPKKFRLFCPPPFPKCMCKCSMDCVLNSQMRIKCVNATGKQAEDIYF